MTTLQRQSTDIIITLIGDRWVSDLEQLNSTLDDLISRLSSNMSYQYDAYFFETSWNFEVQPALNSSSVQYINETTVKIIIPQVGVALEN